MHVIAEERFTEFHHLEQSDTHDGCFCVVAPAQTGNEAGGDGDDVFEGAAEGDAGDVVDDLDVKVGAVEEGSDDIVANWWEGLRRGDEFDFGCLAL